MLSIMAIWKEALSSDAEALKTLAAELQVHPLALEDCLHRDQRAKLEDYGNHQFLVWFLYSHGKSYELQFLIFPDLLLLVAHDVPPTNQTWLEFLKLSLAESTVPHFLWHVLDQVTDLNANEVRFIFSKIQKFEQSLLKGEAEFSSLLPIKKKLSAVEMQLSQLPSLASQLQNFLHPKDSLKWKFRDLHDHCERLYQSILFHQGQISSSFELYWAVAAQKTNLQVKKLTLLAAISVPLSFWAAFWGMNFEAIPFESENFFYIAMIVMFGSVAAFYHFLRSKGYWSN